ncbi:inositol polyphosphate 5-phosphatase K [Scaptodrosophila lebanonensis]|uniref:Inositol polyphosphate 5-phosphatase K n=1 Tax=Drosophila lebanonensis TaxID=7225 RepID=A0A6J2U4C8_DROLE|nr:inositol polyphosphate 5-phosphatase K [Scaptodrosophila lebanonensis]XP_030382322.1 inositol polyphosphate 5-phosphatase K [Scaptodrosophila lebanonensis]XP_030382323.1 inositol polyphosphate 5-phosphatase K [Scaptodrosophila lebanonensis]
MNKTPSSSTAADTINETVDTLISNSSRQLLETYRVYVVTWNVGSRFPDNISLRQLLGLHDDSDVNTKEDQLPDIYAFGLQEVNAQPQHQVLGLFKEDPWTHKAKELLRLYNYVVAKTEQMQGLLLTIFVRRPHVAHLREVEAEFTRTGFGGIWGNKGAVSIRFTLYGCGLAFVVAHLAAHDHQLDERIEDYKQILENHHYHVKRYREIFDHDYVFWFGDLNFRLEGNDSAAEVRGAVFDGRQLDALMKRDQLYLVREQTQKAFHLMHERLPEFPPTFKFKEGTSEYDLKRRPAWTDRIMYAVQPLNRHPAMQLAIEQCSYKSHPAYNISDHKPVTSDFTIKLYPNYRAPCVVFTPIIVWQIGDENTVEYRKQPEFEECANDWIGIYPEDFSSLMGYVAYEYVNQAESPSSPSDNDRDYFDTPAPHRRGRHHHRNRQRLRRQLTATEEEVRIDFADDVELRHGEQYVLIYFQSTGLRGVSSVAGMSNVFVAEKRKGSPHHTEYHVD